jgi:hypothetical protein
MVSIDLKPLTEKTIQEMGYKKHDLWMVKIDSTVFGPFETETLKHYVLDNEQLFELAEASRSDETEWKPFWAHTKFQRRKLQAVNGEEKDGPFWIMNLGLKSGPYLSRDIDKKIEMGLLGMTDHISLDNGETWIKIYEVSGFDRRAYSPDELPIAPSEASFQKARITVVEKLEEPHLNTSEELAELAWEAHEHRKVIEFKTDEILLKQEQTTEVSSSMRYALPRAALVVGTLVIGGYAYMNMPEDDNVSAAVSEEKPFYQKFAGEKRTSSRGAMPTPSFRSPASVGYSHSSPGNESRYPTHVETHDQYPEAMPEPENDPIEGPVTDAENENQPQEHSLVSAGGQSEDSSLDAAMNGTSQPQEQPVVDEASDF